jgi:hypothetical protein
LISSSLHFLTSSVSPFDSIKSMTAAIKGNRLLF